MGAPHMHLQFVPQAGVRISSTPAPDVVEIMANTKHGEKQVVNCKLQGALRYRHSRGASRPPSSRRLYRSQPFALR